MFGWSNSFDAALPEFVVNFALLSDEAIDFCDLVVERQRMLLLAE
jgi:hypothetical protein